jgi:membrane protease YdiL (CAAX protease family)
MAASAVLYTWVFNGTAGSLLTVALLHSSVNTATVFLPIVPSGDSIRPYTLPSVCSASPPSR